MPVQCRQDRGGIATTASKTRAYRNFFFNGNIHPIGTIPIGTIPIETIQGFEKYARRTVSQIAGIFGDVRVVTADRCFSRSGLQGYFVI